MKREQVETYMQEHNILSPNMKNIPGIYAITANNKVIYVGQSIDIYRRIGQHIYNMFNCTIIPNTERKYDYLYAMYIGKMQINFYLIKYVSHIKALLDQEEQKYIDYYKPILNTQLNERLPESILEIMLNYSNSAKELEYYEEIDENGGRIPHNQSEDR